MRKSLLFIGLIFLLMFNTSSFTTAESVERNSSFTTDKGTIISINASIENDGLTTDASKPIFNVNSTYKLSITVSISTLGAEVKDFHDIAFEISVVSESLFGPLGEDLSYYQGYFLDTRTRLLANESMSYNFDIFLSGGSQSNDGKLKVKIAGKENIEENRDPTSTFDAISMELAINPVVSSNNITTTKIKTLNKSMEVFADKETKLRFEFFMDYEGKNNETAKPEILSNTKYLMTFKISVIELGAEARDFHDISIRLSLKDESITDIVPGSSTTYYFSAGLDDTETSLVDGESTSMTLVFYASTNINNTDVSLDITFTGKEDVDVKNAPLGDPKSEFSLGVEFLLNKGISNIFDEVRSQTNGINFIFPFALFIAIPLIRRYK